MTRKRFVKLLMARDYSRNEAKEEATLVQWNREAYTDIYDILSIDRTPMTMEEFMEGCFAVEILERMGYVPRCTRQIRTFDSDGNEITQNGDSEMTQREKLIELLRSKKDCAFECECCALRERGCSYEAIADYLLANGVVVLPGGVDDADELTASILHCLEIADADNENVCAACKQDHLQLASWLNELKQRRSEAEDTLEK